LIEQTRDELEAAGELPEVTDPYVYEQHIDIDEDEENEDSLHKFYLKVRPWPKLALMRIPGYGHYIFISAAQLLDACGSSNLEERCDCYTGAQLHHGFRFLVQSTRTAAIWHA
jgi:hypothetical protein